MLTTGQINTIHQLWSEQWPLRKIERHLKISWRTIKKYLDAPDQTAANRQRSSKLDAFKPVIDDFLKQDPLVSAAVIAQRLRPLGYLGSHTILRGYVQQLRPAAPARKAFVRMEPIAGERFDVDWGHFGTLDYAGDKRKLYAFALVECHSRMLYLEFTHSQSFETFVRCHIHAFHALGGCAREIWFDNLATAVAERDGKIVRFHPRFLAFAKEYGFVPRACNLAAGWEKGKVERAIGYVRKNFWPLREFTCLADVDRQARQWLTEIANRRLHGETRQRPVDRFVPAALRPVATITPDYRDYAEALVYKDIRLHFDGNRYCAPPKYVGQHLVVKADSSSVTLYHQEKELVVYSRSWRRGQTIGAERFEKELLAQKPAAARSQSQRRLIAYLESYMPVEAVESYLHGLVRAGRSLARQLTELLQLISQYGPDAVATAIVAAEQGGAFGADYIANILRQQLCPRPIQPPVQLRDPLLNALATDPVSLLAYDAFILQPQKELPYDTEPEARSTGNDGDEPPTGADPI